MRIFPRRSKTSSRISNRLQREIPSQRDRQYFKSYLFNVSQNINFEIFISANFLKRIIGPSNDFPGSSVKNVPKEVKEKFNYLKEVAEGYSQPERKTTSHPRR